LRRVLLLLAVSLLLVACERETRDFQRETSSEEQVVALSTLSPGDGQPVRRSSPHADEFQNNAYEMSEGKRLYQWYNCVGCHANGGGGSGPALMDAKWIYGGDIENIVATIREGRPNGMPSFRGKIPDRQIWQIAAFVRSLSGNVPSDAAPSRNDDLNAHPPENRLPQLTPKQGGITSPSASMPQ
jgi:cytochrome c oxidase cbb3-type subunit III